MTTQNTTKPSLDWLFFLNHAFKDNPSLQHKLLSGYSSITAFQDGQSNWATLMTYDRRQSVERLLQAFSLDKVLQDLDKHRIQYVTLWDEGYPQQLLQLYDPPLILYFKGDLSLLSHSCLSIVGARQCTHYGRAVTEKLTQGLCKHFVIVSGLALGIDAIAHQVALTNKGKTVAFVANGLDVVYPKSNKKLWEAVEASGCVLSEYPVGTPPLPFRFPQRNRLVAGVSLGVLVTEAKRKSGSLVTCKLAVEQNKEVFAVPGSIFSYASQGCLDLIKDGAVLVQRVQDVLNELTRQPLLLDVLVDTSAQPIRVNSEHQRGSNESRSSRDAQSVSHESQDTIGNIQEGSSNIQGVASKIQGGAKESQLSSDAQGVSSESQGTIGDIQGGAKESRSSSDAQSVSSEFQCTIGDIQGGVKESRSSRDARGVSSEAQDVMDDQLLGVLSAEPQSVDEIVQASGLPIEKVGQRLVFLELNQKVCQFPGQKYARFDKL